MGGDHILKEAIMFLTITPFLKEQKMYPIILSKTDKIPPRKQSDTYTTWNYTSVHESTSIFILQKKGGIFNS